MNGGERILYLQLVSTAFAKRKYANRLLEEAEEDLVKAREIAGDDFEKEERK